MILSRTRNLNPWWRRGEFLEYARVFGRHSYGTPKKWLEESQKSGLDLILEIDVQGASQVKEKLPQSVAIFILPPSHEELERRLRSEARIRTKKSRGAWPRRATKLPSLESITIFV